MDYEKKYNEALSQARFYYGNCPTEPEKKKLEKLFPELRESEEEMTRKKAIAILKQQRDYWSYDGPIDKFPPATPRKDLVDAIDVALSYLEKQKEQKPAEWSEKDEKIRKQLINICNEWLGGGYSARPCLNDIRWLKNLLEKQKEPKHAPDDLQKSFEAGQTSIVDNPEQYGLCKKAEWSEEDDRVFEFAIARVEIYERDFLHGNNEMSERLKALHPRPSWKPSDEQMKALELVVNFLKPRKDTYEPKKITELESLYEQLKKL